MLKIIGRYYECQECKKTFKLPKSTYNYYKKNLNDLIFCPFCNDSNVAMIR